MKTGAVSLLVLALTAASGAGEVLLEEDFQSAEDYQARWQAPPGWSLVEAEIDGKKTTVLNIQGGGAGLSVQGGPEDFDLQADFRVVSGWGGFVFRAQDTNNLYMLQFSAEGDYFSPHTKRGGAYSFVKQPLPAPTSLRQWRHIKVEVRGNRFACYLGKSTQQLELVGRWEGKESFRGGKFGFRCVGQEHMQVDNVRISTSGPVKPELAIDGFALPRMITAGQPFDVKATIRNVGWKAARNVRAKLSLPDGVEPAQGDATVSCGDLKRGGQRQLAWKVKAGQPVAGQIEVALTCDGLAATTTASAGCLVNPPLPNLSAEPVAEAAARADSQANLILENQHLRVVFPKHTAGYGAMVVYVHDGNQWWQAAVSLPIGHVAYRTAAGKTVEADVLPTRYEIQQSGGPLARLRLAAEHVDEDGVRWDFAFTFQTQSDAVTVRTNYQASAKKDRDLLHFQGPTFYAGEGSFGATKDQALFGGLEYLEGEERSSSDRDMVPAIANRYAPHPYKVCMPVMAVAADDILVGLMWDPLQKWDGEHVTLSARFASPNWKDGQDNHLMGLFLPSIPEYVPENKDRAAKPYPLKAGKGICLKASIVAESTGQLTGIVDQYLAAFGPLRKLPLPEDYDAIMKKCRVGYMETMWDPKVVGTKHWDGGPAQQFPNACAILWQDAVWSTDPEVKQKQKDRVKLIVDKALQKKGPAGLVDPIDTRGFGTLPCHIRGYFLPLYVGHLEAGLAAWKERIVKECLQTQRPDGSWPVAGHAGCRQGDEIVSGTIAELAGSVLMYARVTGDQRALKAGLKALEVLDKLPVPRGAQVWECPKYTPDILASGHALWAYLEAYRITGEQKYLERAKYWGKTVFPFVYLWQAPDREIMKYCTIAVFGTTHYKHSWLGRPVQWCGLVPGYWLIRLGEFDDSCPWRELGQGIVDNGIRQMLSVWKQYPGTYTDSIGMIDRRVSSCRFEPESMMKPILLMRDTPVEVSTRIVKAEGTRIHVSTAARLGAAEYDAAKKTLSCQIKYPEGETSYLVIVGITPSQLRKDGTLLARITDLEPVSEGWKLSTEGFVLVKLKHGQTAVRLEVARP